MKRQLVFTCLIFVSVVLSSPLDLQPSLTSTQLPNATVPPTPLPNSSVIATPTPLTNSTVNATLITNPKNFEVLDGVLIGIGALLLLLISFIAWKFSWCSVCRSKTSPPEVIEAQLSTPPGKSKSMTTSPYSLPISVIHAMNGVAETQKVQKGNVFNYTK
ncbi:hypothetical protein K7432_001624 [Basidiobolus ranarum]|uniref:Uncharacterized protein n=1 Tax=Basidiobolus ranarum TaxID=34480 RepID=A0ABR2X2Z3_9FUNG